MGDQNISENMKAVLSGILNGSNLNPEVNVFSAEFTDNFKQWLQSNNYVKPGSVIINFFFHF